MDPTCTELYSADQTGGIYVDRQTLFRRTNECTTNVIGSSVKFTCDKETGGIMEHVFIDATQTAVPETPDCSGALLYTMPIENGCNSYDWGNMKMQWEDFCMPPGDMCMSMEARKDCQSMDGCAWDRAAKACRHEDHEPTCADMTKRRSCQDMDGCEWSSRRCMESGAAMDCTTISDRKPCKREDTCSWSRTLGCLAARNN